MSDTIEELEDLVAEQEPEPKTDTSSLLWSKIAYNVGITVLDAGTGFLVYLLTFWYYGVLWFLAGAVVFFMHQKNYFTAGINDKQQKGAMQGIIVSVISIIAMAMLSGGLYAFGVFSNPIVETGLIIVSVGLFSWHVFRLAMYVFEDDGFQIENTVARAFATANKKVRIAKASGTVVSAYRKAANEKNLQYSKHGKANVDAAIGKMDNHPARQAEQRNRNESRAVPAGSGLSPVFNAETHTVAPMTSKPTSPLREFELPELLKAFGMTADEVRGMMESYGLDTADDAWRALRGQGMIPDGLTRGNFNRLFAELTNPTSGSGRR